MPRRLIQIGVTAAGIDCAMADADVGESTRVVIADRNIAGCIGHPVMDATIPFQRHHRIEVANSRERVGNSAHAVAPDAAVSVPAMLVFT